MSKAISRALLGKIVDEVFDGAIEDPSVIEQIYAVIKREEAALYAAEPVAWVDEQELRYLEMVSGNKAWADFQRNIKVGGEKEGRAPLYAALCTQVQDVAAIAQLNAIVDAWEALPGGRQVRNSDVEAWLGKHMAPAINAIRAFLSRPLPEGA